MSTSRVGRGSARCLVGCGAASLALVICASAWAVAGRLSWSGPIVVKPGPLDGLACPTARQCTGISSESATTFDPRSGRVVASGAQDGNLELAAISCPTRSQCTTVDAEGVERTFKPSSPGSFSYKLIDDDHLVDVSCPSASQCTAVDSGGRKVTFNPRVRTSTDPIALSRSIDVTAVTCP